MLLQAIAYHLKGDREASLTVLKDARMMSEPEGYIRLFVDEGDALMTLLLLAQSQGIHLNYIHRLLQAFGHNTFNEGVSQPLIDSLSERELEVLRLVAEGCSDREIGERLFLVLDTIKGHNRCIFAKLGVSRRTEAIDRASELGLL